MIIFSSIAKSPEKKLQRITAQPLPAERNSRFEAMLIIMFLIQGGVKVTGQNGA